MGRRTHIGRDNITTIGKRICRKETRDENANSRKENDSKKVAKKLGKFIKSKTGYSVWLYVKDIDVFLETKKTKVHLDLEAEMDNSEYHKLLKLLGLG